MSTPRLAALGAVATLALAANGYLFAYQTLTSSASLRGYLQYLTGAARRWK
jgi:hypothetical protein